MRSENDKDSGDGFIKYLYNSGVMMYGAAHSPNMKCKARMEIENSVHIAQGGFCAAEDAW